MGAYYNYDASGERNLKLRGGTVDVADEPVFFYHSDHLGSASYITDDHGYETQHLVYLPFGEDWVDWKYNTSQFETPYKFNGKEKDTETGYNNYGARYYWDKGSFWLSVDPMSDKYPHVTNYIYCSNNPVMVVDPDGMDEYGLDVNTGRLSFIKEKEGKDIISQGAFGKGGVFSNNGKESLSISSDILTSKDKNEDLSKTGILVKGGRQGEGVDLMKFISFNSNKEVSAWGFRDNGGKDGLAINVWHKNTFKRAEGGIYDMSNGIRKIGQRTFFLHTHPGSKNGEGGGWRASPMDYGKQTLGVRSFIFSKTGITEYGNRNGVNSTWTPNKKGLPISLRKF